MRLKVQLCNHKTSNFLEPCRVFTQSQQACALLIDVLNIRIISRPILRLYLRGGCLKTIHRYLILIIICVTCSLALTFTTYFYSYDNDFGYGWAWSVNRGWPLSWAVEMHAHVLVFPPPAFYPFNFQALNFSFDLVFWATVLLLPSSLYLYRKARKVS